MKAILKSTAIILLLSAVLVQAEDKNPLASAKVGDWVSYKSNSRMAGRDTTVEMKQTVTKKTDTELTLEVATKVMGQESKQPVTINLKEKFDPFKQPGQDATVKELGSGTEKLSINGKSYNANWREAEVTANMMGQPVISKTKVWLCPDVPLGGIVKLNSDMTLAMGPVNTTMEIVDSGNGQ